VRRVSPGLIVAAFLLVGCTCAAVLLLFDYEGPNPLAGAPYISRGAADTGATNLVAGIVFDYRLYDTLFEILVFAVAVLGVRFYLVQAEERIEPPLRIPESRLLRVFAEVLFPPILVLGAHLVVYGHLSPGGGFAGGTVAGTGLLLCAVALGAEVVAERFHEGMLERLEWQILLAILLFAAAPVALGRPPLTGLLPRGTAGRLASGGTIPVFNVLVGAKVFIGAWAVIYTFSRHRGEI
jgi:multicomponent Na+:H+ antiporter subunit B